MTHQKLKISRFILAGAFFIASPGVDAFAQIGRQAMSSKGAPEGIVLPPTALGLNAAPNSAATTAAVAINSALPITALAPAAPAAPLQPSRAASASLDPKVAARLPAEFAAAADGSRPFAPQADAVDARKYTSASTLNGLKLSKLWVSQIRRDKDVFLIDGSIGWLDPKSVLIVVDAKSPYPFEQQQEAVHVRVSPQSGAASAQDAVFHRLAPKQLWDLYEELELLRISAYESYGGQDLNWRVGHAARKAEAAQTFPTALRGHVSFFDRDGDGIITMCETYEGFRALGVGRLRSAAAALLINGALGPKTSGRWTTNIDVSNIPRGKHPSDTGVYDADGNFVPAAFEAMFKFDKDNSGSLNELEITAMIDANDKKNPGAKIASKAEFGLLLEIAADAKDTVDGKEVRAITKAALLRFYTDPRFLFDIAEARRK